MKKSSKIIGLIIAAASVVSVAWNIADGEKSDPAVANSKAATDNAVLVNITQVKSHSIPKEVNALGSLSAVEKVTLSAQTDGMVSKINFKNGQEVAKSMPVLEQDNTQANADYQTALTDLRLARKTYERDLQVGDAISQADLEKAKADVESKSADLKSKQAALNQKQITAPFDGVLGDFKVNEGDYVKSGDAIVSLVNLKQLRANYNLPQDLIPLLKKGQMVKITVAAYPNQTFYGTVSYISPSVDPTTRSYNVQALVPNPKELLSPGMFVHLAQQISTVKDALVIPEQAVMTDVKGNYVYTIDDNHAVKTEVKLGARADGLAQVESGLKLNEQVVTAGQQKLADGVLVKVVNAAAPAEPAAVGNGDAPLPKTTSKQGNK